MDPFTQRGASQGVTQKQVCFHFCIFLQISGKLCEIRGTLSDQKDSVHNFLQNNNKYAAHNITGTTLGATKTVESLFSPRLYEYLRNNEIFW